MKNLEKRKVRSHNKVHALFAENKVRFARAEKLCCIQTVRVIPPLRSASTAAMSFKDRTGAATSTQPGLTTATHCQLDYCNASTCLLSRQPALPALGRRYRGYRSGDQVLPGHYAGRSSLSGKEEFWFFRVTELMALCLR